MMDIEKYIEGLTLGMDGLTSNNIKKSFAFHIKL
jgi:hypothetical protein